MVHGPLPSEWMVGVRLACVLSCYRKAHVLTHSLGSTIIHGPLPSEWMVGVRLACVLSCYRKAHVLTHSLGSTIIHGPLPSEWMVGVRLACVLSCYRKAHVLTHSLGSTINPPFVVQFGLVGLVQCSVIYQGKFWCWYGWKVGNCLVCFGTSPRNGSRAAKVWHLSKSIVPDVCRVHSKLSDVALLRGTSPFDHLMTP